MNKTQLRAAMLADLERSGLTSDDARILRLSAEGHTLKPAVAGYVIPYFDRHGKKTKFYRVRYVESTCTGFSALSGAKPQRYSQPANTVNEVYLPPYINWDEYLRSTMPLVITEGEKKSAVATRDGLPTVGLGGVWCFMSKRAESSLLPTLTDMHLKDRIVYICFDSDAATNADIIMAEATLAKRLIEHGARVLICRIPAHKGAKVGIDDYILAHDIHRFKRNILNKAFEYESSKALHALNAELVYIRRLGFVYDYVNEMRVSATALIQHAYSNRWVDVPAYDKKGDVHMTRKNAAKLWLEWEHRAELPGMTYAPGQSPITDRGELNTWRGWGVDRAERGCVEPWNALLTTLFGEHHAERTWFEQWCAYPIQHPGVKMASAVLLWGAEQGTGKTLCGHTLMRLYGDNATEVKDSDIEDASFTWAENKQFVLADDITGQNNRKLANRFKTMITQKTIHINQKYIPRYSVPDCINYYFTSNDPDAFYLDDKDRRFFIHEVLADRMSSDMRRRYVAWMNSTAGLRALFYHMLTLDLGGFDPQAEAMQTVAKRDMTHIGKSELGAWVHRLREEPDAVLAKMKGDLFTAEELHLLYDPLGDKRASANALARELKRSGFLRIYRPGGAGVRIDGKQLRLYAVRNADKWKGSVPMNTIVDHYTESRCIREKF